MRFLNSFSALLLFFPMASFAQVPIQDMKEVGQDVSLPQPKLTKDKVVRRVDIEGWKGDQTPKAPQGFKVTRFAKDLKNPRSVYVLPNGDVLVAEATGIWKPALSANRVTLLRDTDKDGVADEKTTFLDGLTRPYGMLVMGDYFYVANTDGIMRYPYRLGQKKIEGKGEEILELPAGGYNNHWTRNIIANKDGTKIMVSVGSGSNNGENGMDKEARRANILEINPDGSGEEIFAAGLRNPVGMDYEPVTGALWTAVNERDELGDNLVPDYITSVKRGGFYGWPYAYFGPNEDPRMKDVRPDLVKSTLVPDYALGSHTASLGMAFYTKEAFPEHYQGGAFVAQHGSWNRTEYSGYQVVFVPFKKGKPNGKAEPFLTGFIKNAEEDEAFGRPVDVKVTPEGALLVTDDSGDTVWQVTAEPSAKKSSKKATK